MTSPEVRIGDAERESAVSALGDHYLAGRISKEEYDERTSVAWRAKTNSELWPLFADLPALRPKTTPVHVPAPNGAGRSGHKSRVPLLPLLLVIVAVLAITNVPWWAWLIVIWMWATGMFSRLRHWGHREGGHG
jgi:hypothetical protein